MEVNALLLNSNRYIAFKNYFGQYEIKEFSLFRLEKVYEGFTHLKINIIKNKEILISMKCPICDEIHTYNYNIDELLKRELLVGGCEIMGTPLFYIGSKKNVEEYVLKYNEINKKIYAMI